MNTDDKQRNEAMTAALRILGERFEHVQIMVSWNEQGGSYRAHTGSGNWYARQGLAHEFIQKDIAQENAHQIAKLLPPSS